MAKFVEQRNDASGRTYWVFNPKKYIRDALDVGYQRFRTREEAIAHSHRIVRQYEDHKSRTGRAMRIEEDTVAGLVSFYKSTYEWKKLTDNSQRLYDTMIRTAFNLRIGSANVTFDRMLTKNVTPTHADKMQAQIAVSHSDHRAVHVMKVLRKIWYVGRRHGKVAFNPFERMGLKGLESRIVLWEIEEVEKLVQTADKYGASSIGTLAILCYEMCQRPSDMRKLRWFDIRNGQANFIQEKTGTKVSFPISETVERRLAELDTSTETIVICEATQRPYDRRLYGKWFARIRKLAGLPDHLQLRDLRRTGATLMAESNCTEDELRSVTGHQSRDVLGTYVRPTLKLAASGMNKRSANTRALKWTK
jgi:integrase